MKKISVIIPVYNAVNWIEKSFNCLVRQTIFDELEIIFVNDGSVDETEKELKKLTHGYNNVIIICKKNGGVSSARNAGIKKATSRYITFLDVDDYIEEDFFEKLYTYKDYDFVSTGFVAEYSNSSVSNKVKNKIVIEENVDIIKNIICDSSINPNCWGKLFKRELIEKLTFDENLKYGEDYLFVFEYLLNCNNAVILPLDSYHYIINDSSAMRKKFNDNRFKAIDTAEKITAVIKERYPSLYEYSKSKEIDTKCRLIADLYFFNQDKKYKLEIDNLYHQIKNYSIIKKKKYSSKKHFYAFVLMKISPKLYVFIKKTLKFEYKR